MITHTDAVSVPGYIITDPVTGDGAYKIAGGGNGSYFTGLFLGFTLSLIIGSALTSIVLSAGIAGAGLIPLLTSLFGHLTLLSLLLVEMEGFDRQCFVSGLFAGLAPLAVVFFAGFGSFEAGVSSVLTIMGFTNIALDLEGSREACGI